MPQTVDAAQISLDGLEWRQLGPFRGGRVEAVAGDPRDRNTFYFGSCGGGVWKTTDGGLYWRNVSDGFFKRASVGGIAVAASDPNVIYSGMGEGCIRGNVSHGDGAYRSTDGGKTWAHLGLEATRNIAQVRVHPQDPDTAYVAALGHAHGPNVDRGIFRTRDGGKSWKKILSRGDTAGGIDVSIDQSNPRIVYAALWEAIRKPHQLISGGAGSGIFKSTDGGDTWTEISRNRGLPKGVLGRIGIAVSPARPERVWALVEATDGGVFRSDNGGLTWEKGSDDRELRQRAWYYTHIFADPVDADTTWVLNVDAYKSSDAGKSFVRQTIPHGDNHDLWIDPNDPLRMIEGNDGGATISFNGGMSWSSLYNQPTAEYYHITADAQTPYRLYAAQQDNSSISSPTRSALSGVLWQECYEVGGGEAGHIAVRPDDHHIVFAADHAGLLTRYDRRSGQIRTINVWPEASSGIAAKDIKYRFNWTAPVSLSPHDPDVLYTCSQYVHRTRDEGTTWQRVSPDLTRNDKKTTGDSGGPVTLDQTGAEYYATIFAFAESPAKPGVLWAGSDDGLIHISRDNGKKWTNVTPTLIAPFTLVSIIEPSPHDPAVAYVAATRYKHDDFAPYLYKTANYGTSWTKITAGIGADDFTRVIREDPAVAGLLYAGTETGLYYSLDGGARWQRWQGKSLPVVPIHDLIVKDGDLCLATHGRSFWVFDDLTPVRELATRAGRSGRARLFTPRPTIRYRTYGGFSSKTEVYPMKNYRHPGGSIFASVVEERPNGDKVETNLDAGKNPPDAVIVSYWLKTAPKDITLTFLDARGRAIRSFTQRPAEEDPKSKEPRVAVEPGANRFLWEMCYPDAAKITDEPSMEQMEMGLKGPTAAPGRYLVRLEVDGERHEAPFEIRSDPRIDASQADLDAQFKLRMRIRDAIDRTHTAVNRLRDARKDPRITPAARKTLDAIEARLMQPKAKSRQDTLNFGVRLNNKLAALQSMVASADTAPTKQSIDLTSQLEAELGRLEKRLDAAIGRKGRRTKAA
ncbi:MAG TPA: glycosyl hydrolase [Candidatus Limnocylindria bacterium]|nr:glycosyl hydrolase [Candidatus Limnocylindria bacterium]